MRPGEGELPMTPTTRLSIAEYDPGWRDQFETERARIADALGPLARRIDHNGSTAVPGLDAKPVIDIQISVDMLEPLTAYAAPLAAIGYTHLPHADDAVCPFFYRPATWPHTHHLHVVQAGGDEERRTLAFRDYLRDHPDVAARYAALKRDLASRADADDAESREAYALAKTDFVEEVLRTALASDYPRAL
jgi:GrpB-like predicted nucleotidyltransferase (UPF0157 family)